MQRCTTDTCSLTLPLITEKWQADRLNKRLELGRKLYNTLVRQKMTQYQSLSEQTDYAEIVSRMKVLFENKQRDSDEYMKHSKRRTEMLRANGFTEFDFVKSMTPMYKVFNKNIDSNMAQVIAKNVWNAFKRFLYGNAKQVSYKKPDEFNSLAGKRNRSSIKYADGKIKMTGLTIAVKLNPNNTYEREMLSKRIKFCAVKRVWVKNKYQYLLVLFLEGCPVVKIDSTTGEAKHPVGNGRVGLYIGMRKVAYASEKEVGLETLAAGIEEIERQKEDLRRRMKRSQRAMNPDKWPKGEYIKPNVILEKSNNYVKLRNRYRNLCRKATEITKIEHSLLANRLLALGNELFSNRLDYQGFQANPLKRPAKHKRVPKRHYGEVIGRHSPGKFLRILRLKVENSGQATLNYVDPYSAKVRQFNHLNEQAPKGKRGTNMVRLSTDVLVERDIYSAFLIQNIQTDLKAINTQIVTNNFDRFMSMSVTH